MSSETDRTPTPTPSKPTHDKPTSKTDSLTEREETTIKNAAWAQAFGHDIADPGSRVRPEVRDQILALKPDPLDELEDLFQLGRRENRTHRRVYAYTPPPPLRFVADVVRELDALNPNRRSTSLARWLNETAQSSDAFRRAMLTHALTVIATGATPDRFDAPLLAPMIRHVEEHPASRVRIAAAVVALCWVPSDKRQVLNEYLDLLMHFDAPKIADLAKEISFCVLKHGKDDDEFLRRLLDTVTPPPPKAEPAVKSSTVAGPNGDRADAPMTIEEMRLRFGIRVGARLSKEAALEILRKLIADETLPKYALWPNTNWASVFGVDKSTIGRWKSVQEVFKRLRQTEYKPGSSVQRHEFDNRTNSHA